MARGRWVDALVGVLFFGVLAAGLGEAAISVFERGKFWNAFLASLIMLILLSAVVASLPIKNNPVLDPPRRLTTSILVTLAIVFGAKALWDVILILRVVLSALNRVQEDLVAAGIEFGVIALLIWMFSVRGSETGFASPVARRWIWGTGVVAVIMLILSGWVQSE